MSVIISVGKFPALELLDRRVYYWPFNNMGLNFTGPLTRRCFPIADNTARHNLQLVEPSDTEP